jgi:type II secretory pathway component PulF
MARERKRANRTKITEKSKEPSSSSNNLQLKFLLKYSSKLIKRDREHFLIYLKSVAKSGSSIPDAIELQVDEYKKKKKILMVKLLEDLLFYSKKGTKLIDALYKSNLINENEYTILNKSKSLDLGINQINDSKKTNSRSTAAYILLFAPPYIMITALLLTHGIVKDTLDSMFLGMVQSGAKAPPMAEYLSDPTAYIHWNILFWGILIVSVIFLAILKRYNTKTYFKIMFLSEKEYLIDILYSIKSLTEAGLNMADSVEILAKGEPNFLKKKVYEELNEEFKKGKIKFSETLNEFGFNSTSCSLLRIGETTGKMKDALDNTYENLVEINDKIIEYALKTTKISGQILMMLVFGKPMIDILILMTTGMMNFEI